MNPSWLPWALLGVNLLIGLVNFFGGLVIKGILDDIKELRQRVTDCCVRREDCQSFRGEIVSRLNGLDAKLDRIIERKG